MSQEQKDKIQQQEAIVGEKEATQEATTDTTSPKERDVYIDVPTVTGKKRKKRKFRERLVYESEISPRPSIWPLALAFSVSLLLFGLIYNVYFLGIGVVLVLVSIVGWVLERQKA